MYTYVFVYTYGIPMSNKYTAIEWIQYAGSGIPMCMQQVFGRWDNYGVPAGYVEYRYTNQNNVEDTKTLARLITLDNPTRTLPIYYENEHKRALLEVENPSGERQKLILINNRNDPGVVEELKFTRIGESFDEEEFMCNVCNEDIHRKYMAGLRINHIYVESTYTRGARYTCPYCSTRLRDRTLKRLLGKTITQREDCIVNSANPHERNVVSTYLNIAKHIDYHIQRGDPICEIGVDISKPIKTDRKYKYFIAACVFDYIVDLESVFSRISDILEDDGKIIFWISPYRLSSEYFEPRVTATNALSHEFVNTEKIPGQDGFDSCMFSVPWIKNTLEKLHFDFKIHTQVDILTSMTDDWFIAQKLPNPER